MTRQARERDQEIDDLLSWLRAGIENNYCTNIVCETHDSVPRTDEEENEFEEGGDPCCFVVRINTELSTLAPFIPKPKEQG